VATLTGTYGTTADIGGKMTELADIVD